MITIFKPTAAPVTAPIYAAFEGVFLGAISQMIQMQVWGSSIPGAGGIVMQAVSLTAGVLFVMMFVYATRSSASPRSCRWRSWWRPVHWHFSTSFRWCSACSASAPMVFAATPLGIGFSLFVVGLAAFNLLLDFDFIEKSAQHEAPKFMEWYGAFGLMVTLIWLYLEILRLLMKLADRR